MSFYEIATCDTEDNETILWSSDGVRISEGSDPAVRAVHKLRVSCDFAFSNDAALRALKAISRTVSPEILELHGFEELDLTVSSTDRFTTRAFAIIVTNAAKRWPRIHTLSLVDCQFMGSYDRDAMAMLFGSLPTHVHTLKVTGEVSLMIDRYDPSTDDNGLRVPLNFDVIDMSGVPVTCIEEISALTESFLLRCVRREGRRHEIRTTRPKIIFPPALAAMNLAAMRGLPHADDANITNPLVCFMHAKDVPIHDVPPSAGAGGAGSCWCRRCPRPPPTAGSPAAPRGVVSLQNAIGPPTFHQSALEYAMKQHLIQHVHASPVYRAGFVELFRRMESCGVHDEMTITADELVMLGVFYARVLMRTDDMPVDQAMLSEAELGSILTQTDITPTALRQYMDHAGLTSEQAVDNFFPAWTDETTARWELILVALTSAPDVRGAVQWLHHHAIFDAPDVQTTLSLLADPLYTDVVHAPLHIAQFRRDVQTYCDWHKACRATHAIVAAAQRDLAAPGAPGGAGDGGGGAVARTVVETVRVVSVVQQWMATHA